MNDKLKVGQDISPGLPGDLSIIVDDVSNQFITVVTTYPTAITHEVLWLKGYKYVGPTVPFPDDLHWAMTYQRHF